MRPGCGVRGMVPLVVVEAVKERRARGEDVRATRARREPCSVLDLLP